MKIAITGGTGFVGSHLARDLRGAGHEVVVIARGVGPGVDANVVTASVTDEESLVGAFNGCATVIHCAGINRELGFQTYEAVHVQGTRNVVSAAKRAGVERIALLSYLRARSACGSGYLESKWQAEEIVRSSGLRFLVIKAGMIFGLGDHMLDHTAKSLGTFRIFTRVGISDRPVMPVAVGDVVRILRAFAVGGELEDRTVAVRGPERLALADAARRIAGVLGIRALIVPMPIPLLYLLGWIAERIMKVPLVSVAQVRLLREGPEPGPMAGELPADLRPQTRFTSEVIERGLPRRRRYGITDLRWFR